MSALDVAVLVIGSSIAPILLVNVDVAGVGDEARSCSVIGVEIKDTWPGTVTKLRMRATTATGAVTFPGTARSPKRKESSCATPAAKLDTWPATAIMLTSRSATRAEGLATSRNFAIR